MLHALARNWWAVLIRGIAAVIFGLFALIAPGPSGLALVLLFGAYAFVDGVFALVAAVRAAEAHERWIALALEGVVGLVVAGLTLYHPLVVGIALYYLIAAWALVTGIFEIVASMQLRQYLKNEWLLILSGIASIVFGAMLVVFPIAGAVTVIFLIGAYAVIFGVMLIGFSLRLRPHARG